MPHHALSATLRFAATIAALSLAALLLAGCLDAEPPDAPLAPAPPDAPGTLTSLREADFTAPAVLAELFLLSGTAAEVEPARTHFEDLIGGDGVEEAVVFVESGGTAAEMEPERTHFEDLIGDEGVEEAVVFVESGGTAGDVGAAIYRLVDGRAQLVQYIRAGGHVEVRLGLIVVQQGVYASGDAQCCPSSLRETAYGWDGERFAEVSTQVVPNEQ